MKIPILVTLDENYLPQLRVLLTSIYLNHPGQEFCVYLLHSRISEKVISELSKDLEKFKYELHSIKAQEKTFLDAKITDRYPKEMYYRLLASEWLPQNLEKILYIDPDTLVINEIYELWNQNIDDYIFAACSHTGKTEVANSVNRIRLGTDTDYFNSGVLLINLKNARKEINPEEIFEYVEENPINLLLPDQDVLNALYADRILKVKDSIWNYDARNYSNYLLRSQGKEDIVWVLKNTAILHFCGRDKPWKDGYRRRFGILYRHYMSLADRYLNGK